MIRRSAGAFESPTSLKKNLDCVRARQWHVVSSAAMLRSVYQRAALLQLQSLVLNWGPFYLFLAQARDQNPGGPSRHRYPARAFARPLFEIVSDISGSVDFSLRRCVAQSVFGRAVAAGWDCVSVEPIGWACGRDIGLSRSRIAWNVT